MSFEIHFPSFVGFEGPAESYLFVKSIIFVRIRIFLHRQLVDSAATTVFRDSQLISDAATTVFFVTKLIRKITRKACFGTLLISRAVGELGKPQRRFSLPRD